MKELKNVKLHINRSLQEKSNIEHMGFFGNVWVRSHYFEKAGHTNGGGHRHNFDHVTLLAVGSVLCEVEGHTPKEFHAPTFITIDKDHSHKFTALTDGVVYYCIFAVRDLNGEVVENLYAKENCPLDDPIPPYYTQLTEEDLKKLRAEYLENPKKEI